MLMAVVAMLASCSKDLTSDVNVGVNNGEESVDGVVGGIELEISMGEFTRVNIESDFEDRTSKLYWEVGDQVTVVYNGKSYVYVATKAGRTSNFVARDDDNTFYPTDLSKPMAVFYNVNSIDAVAMTAVYDIASNQVEGELTNKMPLYFYSSTVPAENGKLVITMDPLASVVEFELSASESWNADALSLGKSSRQLYTYASAKGLVIDAATGDIDLSKASLGNTIEVKLSAMHDFATKRKVIVIVPGVSNAVTTEVAEGEGTTTVTTHYAPVYYGKACIKLFKNGVENFRRTIWKSYTVDTSTPVNERVHIGQPLKDILTGHKNGITTAADFKAFADEINYAVETYPCGTGFCNEDGVVVLNNDIDISEYSDWLAIGSNYSGTLDGVEAMFAGHFDGNNKTISGLKSINTVDDKVEYIGYDGSTKYCPWLCCGLFGALWGGSIKNLTVKGEIISDYYESPASNWVYAGGLIAHHFGGVIDNCKSYVKIGVGSNCTGRVRLGGVVGRMAVSASDATLTNCENHGEIDLTFSDKNSYASQIGGVVGCVGDVGSGDTFVFENCVNHASIKVKDFYKTSRIGGVAGYIFYVEGAEPAIFKNLKNKGNITISSKNPSVTATYFGGLVANMEYHSLEKCVNEGNITFESLDTAATVAMGGVVGRANADAAAGNAVVSLTDCINTGDVTMGEVNINKGWIGGVAGCSHAPCLLTRCHNLGNVTVATNKVSGASAFIGGISGLAGWESNKYADLYVVSGCNNYGIVTIGKGAVNGGWRFSGGIAGMAYGGSGRTDGKGLLIDNCANYGTVHTVDGEANIIGGIIGAAWHNPTVRNSHNYGNVVSERKLNQVNGNSWEGHGGIVGYIYTKETKTTISGCNNTGLVGCRKRNAQDLGETDTNVYVVIGGIQGSHGCAGATVANCKNSGKVLGPHDALHKWNATKEVWDVSGKVNFVYRAAFVAHPNGNLVCNNNIVSGYIGTIADQDPTKSEAEVTIDKVTYKYDKLTYADGVVHALNNDSTSDWYWKKWRHGYTATPATSKTTTTFEPIAQ